MSGGTIYHSSGKEQFTNENPAIVTLKGTSLPTGDNTIGSVKLANPNGNLVTISTGANSNDGTSGSNAGLYTTDFNLLFNGGSWDRMRNNFEGTMISSGKRTSSAISSLITNYNARGLLLYLDVTQASGTGGLKLIVRGKDPTTGTMKDLYSTTTAVTAVGSAVYAVAPAISFTGSRILQTFNGLLPRVFDVYVLAGDSSEYTYTLGYALLL